ncbi:MAG: T9SS type A sorting domain-containing protein [Chitinophagales bacterium]|nr:T9SS type A sorting domain-containing protein [Chitinophagales bacterium]
MKTTKKGFKMAAYSTAAMATLLSLPANGQIVYHDIDPDLVKDPEDICIPEPPGYDFSPGNDFSCGQTFTEFFDINADAVVDFKIKLDHDYWSLWPSQYHENSASLFLYNLNKVGGDNNDVYKYAMGDAIDLGVNWIAGHPVLGFYNYEINEPGDQPFIDSKYAFSAFRLQVGAAKHFAWIRLSVDPLTDRVIVHDYAYNSSAGATILAGETGDCYPPSISEVVNITPASAKLQWAPVFNATKYQLYYRKSGVAAWTKLQFGPATIQKTITGLLCDSEYEWKMRTKCGAELSDFSAIHTFNTASCRIEEMAGDKEPILIYPNPASHNIIIELQQFSTMENEDIKIDIFDVTGRKMDSYVTTNLSVNLNISAFPKGNYIVKVNSATFNSVGKFIVQ